MKFHSKQNYPIILLNTNLPEPAIKLTNHKSTSAEVKHKAPFVNFVWKTDQPTEQLIEASSQSLETVYYYEQLT